MSERERDTPDVEASAARQAAEEPEPDWAQQIRDLRRARGERLKEQLGSDETVEGRG